MKAYKPRRPKKASKTRRDYPACNMTPVVSRLWSVNAISDRKRMPCRVYSQDEIKLFNRNLVR